jgi:hypothetical protein
MIKPAPSIRSLAAILCLALAIICAPAPRTFAAGSIQNESASPADNIPKPIQAAVNSAVRPAADVAMDATRQPAQVMAFYDIKPGLHVADLWAGGGYTTELLALIDRQGLFAESSSQRQIPEERRRLAGPSQATSACQCHPNYGAFQRLECFKGCDTGHARRGFYQPQLSRCHRDGLQHQDPQPCRV